MIEIGKQAPDFELPDQNGVVHRLSDYRGKKVILYFYPKDNTSGCTKQACGFRDRLPQFKEKDAVVLGVSKDSVASHKKFEQNFDLGFTLLSDADLTVIKAYEVWQEKKLYGNRERDKRNQKELEEMGWNVITVWECQLKKDKREKTLEELYNMIIT